MTRRFALVANPRAGKGRAPELAGDLARVLAAGGHDVRTETTAAPGDGARIAYFRAFECDAIVALGGDGTLHEVANGVARAAAEAGDPGRVAAVGVVPFGGGNDYIKALCARRPTVIAALQGLRAGPRRRVDLLRARRTGPASPTGHGPGPAPAAAEEYAINQVQVGYGGAVTEGVEAVRRFLHGQAAYTVSGLLALASHEVPEYRLVLDGARAVAGRFLEIHVANGPFCGGGASFTPQARLDDGLLDLCLVEARSFARNFRTLLPLLGPGLKPRDGVRMERARRVRIDTDVEFTFVLDGEVRKASAAERLDVEVAPAALDVLVPV